MRDGSNPRVIDACVAMQLDAKLLMMTTIFRFDIRTVANDFFYACWTLDLLVFNWRCLLYFLLVIIRLNATNIFVIIETKI